MATKRRVPELLKQYYEDMESLTPEECARLHQYASDEKKEMEQIAKVMTDMLLNVYSRDFPKIVNLRTAGITEGSERAPKDISWQEVTDNKLPIDKETFLNCSVIKLDLLRTAYPTKAVKLERSKWFMEHKTTTAAYIKWSAPIKRVVK